LTIRDPNSEHMRPVRECGGIEHYGEPDLRTSRDIRQ